MYIIALQLSEAEYGSGGTLRILVEQKNLFPC